jgi:hypothetical protein
MQRNADHPLRTRAVMIMMSFTNVIGTRMKGKMVMVKKMILMMRILMRKIW